MDDIKVRLAEEFGTDIMHLSDFLIKQKCNSAIITQVLKSGTSIGANIYEAIYAESNSDFIHKLRISQKEASETKYWLKLLVNTNYIDQDYFNILFSKCEVILKILSSIIKSCNKEI